MKTLLKENIKLKISFYSILLLVFISCNKEFKPTFYAIAYSSNEPGNPEI
jgi:hypothetical protein